MLKKLAESIYNAYLGELRKGGAGRGGRRKMLRKARRALLRMGDPDVIAQLDDFGFRTPFSSNILLFHFEYPFYDSTLPRLARAVSDTRGSLAMVDIGANVGSATYLVSRESAGHFLCLEANPRFKASLTHNLAQIPQSRARLAALTDRACRTPVRHNYLDGNSSLEAAPEGGEALEFVTLDEALAREPDYPAPNLVKIDTEGFELKILRGASRLLAEQRPTLFFEFFPAFIRREGNDPDELFDLLLRQGYDYFIFYDGAGNILVSVTGDQKGQLQSLRRFCQLNSSFFDVAAFHAGDSTLRRRFQDGEDRFFERAMRPQTTVASL